MGVVWFSYGTHRRAKESLRYSTVSTSHLEMLRIDDSLFVIMIQGHCNNHKQAMVVYGVLAALQTLSLERSS